MQSAIAHGLLADLPPAVYERLAPNLKRVRLEAGSILYDVGETIHYAWFITEGIVSMLSLTEEGDSVETVMVGRESLISMLLGMRDTAVTPPLTDALPAGAISYCRQPSWPSYQNASCTEPLAPTHHISMLLGMRDTSVPCVA